MRAGSLTTVSWPGIGLMAVISEIVASSVIFQPWITTLWSSSSSQTVGDPLLGGIRVYTDQAKCHGSLPHGSVHELAYSDHQLTHTAKSRPDCAVPHPGAVDA